MGLPTRPTPQSLVVAAPWLPSAEPVARSCEAVAEAEVWFVNPAQWLVLLTVFRNCFEVGGVEALSATVMPH